MKIRFVRVLVAFVLCTFGFTASGNSTGLLWFLEDSRAEAVWASAGTEYSGSKSFRRWLESARASTALPEFRNTLSLNCWEYVLYTAFRTNRMTLEEAKAVHAGRMRGQALADLLGREIGSARYNPQEASIRIVWPAAATDGDVVLMDQSSHVVQLTHQVDSMGRRVVVSFSPRPIWGDGASEWPMPSTKPELTTVESLIEQMRDLYPDVPSDWQNIELKVVRLKSWEDL